LLRLPVLDKVKTRIAAQTDAATALHIYKSLVTETLATVSNLPVSVYLVFDGGLPDKKDREPHFKYRLQCDGDLGEKIIHALETGLAHHTGVVIIGSDCPALSAGMIMEAFGQLDHHDIVIGPAADGGYYLLGCKETNRGLFEDMAWSSDKVLSTTLARCRQLQLSVYMLPELHDVDTIEDWYRFQETIPAADHLRP
jgi:rSAM/selenodomain-associated transferase 1